MDQALRRKKPLIGNHRIVGRTDGAAGSEAPPAFSSRPRAAGAMRGGAAGARLSPPLSPTPCDLPASERRP